VSKVSEVTICWRFASRLLLASLALVASVGGPLLACGNGSATPPDGGACAVDVPQGCPSWAKDVKPIIDARCLGCHGEGGIASSRFDYTTYAGVFRAHASILSQVDWTGPAHGKMLIQAASGTVQANMAGQLDLSLAQKGSAPLAPISGKWHGTKGFGVGGTFSGVFEVPFLCGDVSPTGACYVESGRMVPAATGLVKLVVTFYSK